MSSLELPISSLWRNIPVLGTYSPDVDTPVAKKLVTVDGQPGSGKTTISELIAERYGYNKATTGMLYCATGMVIREAGIDIANLDEALEAVVDADIQFDISNPRQTLLSINGKDVSGRLFEQQNKSYASVVGAQQPIVRQISKIYHGMTKQKDMVFDRGYLTFPNSDLKIWLAGSPRVRAERRQKQLVAEGKPYLAIGEIMEDNARREQRDQIKHGYGPSIDSLFIDTSGLSVNGVFKRIEPHLNRLAA